MANTIIPAKEVGKVIYEDLRTFAKTEFPEYTDAEIDGMMVKFFDALSLHMFGR